MAGRDGLSCQLSKPELVGTAAHGERKDGEWLHVLSGKDYLEEPNSSISSTSFSADNFCEATYAKTVRSVMDKRVNNFPKPKILVVSEPLIV